MSYQYLDHTADVIVHAKGESLESAFEQAALAFYDVISDLKLVAKKITKEISIESEDFKALLFDWIDQLIFFFDTEYLICSDVKVTSIIEKSDTVLLKATITGEEFDIDKHPQETEVKAMTYSFMKIGDNFVEFTLDL